MGTFQHLNFTGWGSEGVKIQIQVTVPFPPIFFYFSEMFEHFQFLATDQGQCFLLMLFLPPWAMEKSRVARLMKCSRAGNRSTMPGSDLYLERNTSSFLCCFGTFSISSFTLHFVCSENYFNSFQKNGGMIISCSKKYMPHFELPQNSVPRQHKAQYRNKQTSMSLATFLF